MFYICMFLFFSLVIYGYFAVRELTTIYPNGIPVFESRSPGIDGRGDYSFKKLVFSE